MQIGRKIGVKIKIAGVGSIKVPTNKSTKLIIKRVITLLFVNVNIALEIIVGISVYAIIQDMIEDTPIRNTMITVVLAESRMILGRSFALILL